MAMIIRMAWNNKDWKGACDTPGKDPLCWYCFKGLLQIEHPKKDDIICSGDCWERRLCKEFKWGGNARGKVFGPRSFPGVPVFFTFKQPDGNYTIWGRSVIQAVDAQPMKSTYVYEDGYTFVHFEPFEPLPRDKWVKNISDVELVGARWLQGRYRFIDAGQEAYLDKLISGQAVLGDGATAPGAVKTPADVPLSASVAPVIYKQMEEISLAEGRSINELVREAIAKWLRAR